MQRGGLASRACEDAMGVAHHHGAGPESHEEKVGRVCRSWDELKFSKILGGHSREGEAVEVGRVGVQWCASLARLGCCLAWLGGRCYLFGSRPLGDLFLVPRCLGGAHESTRVLIVPPPSPITLLNQVDADRFYTEKTHRSHITHQSHHHIHPTYPLTTSRLSASSHIQIHSHQAPQHIIIPAHYSTRATRQGHRGNTVHYIRLTTH